MKSLLIVVCAFALTYGLPKNNVNTKIVHGRPANDGEFPHQVALVKHGNFICGGSLIRPNVVLTAAHCLTPYGTGNLKFHAGSISLDDPNAQVRDVYSFKIHELYNDRTLSYDVALVILDEAFELSEKVQIIEIETDEVPLDSQVTASGWGRMENKQFPSNLRAVNTTIVDCAGFPKLVPDYVICTDGYYSICSGDSGGPLVHNGKQLGVVSATQTILDLCGWPFSFNFYINLRMFYPWIQEKLINKS